jgi:FkbM family methyltransferase
LLAKYLPKRPGFFIEAGANDGYRQSNTYYLEQIKGWRGLLIEPLPRLAAKCQKTRPRSTVRQCALVGNDLERPKISLLDLDLMSFQKGAYGGNEKEQRRIQLAMDAQNLESYGQVEVKTSRLSSILDEIGSPPVDFFSLDVESSELDVLSGLDLQRHRPTWILVETQSPDAVLAALPGYAMEAKLTQHDYLYFDHQNGE